MARKPRLSKGIVMRPNFFVFCEGDTEVKYVELLRSHFRQPIHIIAKKTLLNITPELVERCKATYIQTKDDHTFLMYDLDVPTMLERLKKISDADKEKTSKISHPRRFCKDTSIRKRLPIRSLFHISR